MDESLYSGKEKKKHREAKRKREKKEPARSGRRCMKMARVPRRANDIVFSR